VTKVLVMTFMCKFRHREQLGVLVTKVLVMTLMCKFRHREQLSGDLEGQRPSNKSPSDDINV
jgi:hypothetical protein